VLGTRRVYRRAQRKKEQIMPVVHHIPVCPFSQRLEILLELKGCRSAVTFSAVDITVPRTPELLALTGGSTALPVAVLGDGTVLRESMVILRYLDTALHGPRVAQSDPVRHALESLLVVREGAFADAGYRLLMNRDPSRRDALTRALLDQYASLDDALRRCDAHSSRGHPGPWCWSDFGWAEAVYTPLFMRFWCLGYYEGFVLPDGPRWARMRAWEQACLAHPVAQQVTCEQVVKLYVDYALGVGNGALPPGRAVSSFAITPHWAERPWPSRDKYGAAPTDADLGLVAPRADAGFSRRHATHHVARTA
jgi:glutathione S-transferase